MRTLLFIVDEWDSVGTHNIEAHQQQPNEAGVTQGAWLRGRTPPHPAIIHKLERRTEKQQKEGKRGF
eukprot:NODE_1663_length_508_cov_8.888889_g1586_i0.p2 GENE.NODE_1663_length_508_cov_8.888889_g1586_i0~~NODE_1663_length_508_cov_8.888889_g1586_i0.p2  ORF type:complete len:67 (-),score=13.89 NODE_1663_length_508_cov_8.888889_g1586_i0:68-268(-)